MTEQSHVRSEPPRLVIVEDVAGETVRGTVIGKAGLGTMMVKSQPGHDYTGGARLYGADCPCNRRKEGDCSDSSQP